MLNIENLIEENITIKKYFGTDKYDEVKRLANNIGTEKRPRYEAIPLTNEQKKVVKKIKLVKNVNELVQIIDEYDELDNNYNYFFIVKHLNSALKNVKKPEKVKENLNIVNRWIRRLSAQIPEKNEEEIILDKKDNSLENSSLRNLEIESINNTHKSNIEEYITNLDKKYSGTPEFEEKIIKDIKRPSTLSNALKEKYGYECMICGYPGFEKKNGNKYAEAHHMWELHKKALKTLQSWNILILCPTCHRKLHYADVKYKQIDKGWKINLEGNEYIINNEKYFLAKI